MGGGGTSACLPLPEAKILQALPAFRDHQLTSGLAKGVPSAATQVRLAALGIGDPIEDLLREHLLAELGRLWTDLVEERAGEVDWAAWSASAKGRARAETWAEEWRADARGYK